MMRCATSNSDTLHRPGRQYGRQQEADKPAVKWRYLFGFLAWTVLNAIVIALCAGASVLTIKRIK